MNEYADVLEKIDKMRENNLYGKITLVIQHIDEPDKVKKALGVESNSLLSGFIDDFARASKSDNAANTLEYEATKRNAAINKQQKEAVVVTPEHFIDAEMNSKITRNSPKLKEDMDLLRQSLGLNETSGFCETKEAQAVFDGQPVTERLMRLTDQKISKERIVDIMKEATVGHPETGLTILSIVNDNKKRFTKDYGVTEEELTALVSYTAGSVYPPMQEAMRGAGDRMEAYCNASNKEDKAKAAAELANFLNDDIDIHNGGTLNVRSALAISGVAMRAMAKIIANRKAPPMNLGRAVNVDDNEKMINKYFNAQNFGGVEHDYGFGSASRYSSKEGIRSSSPIHLSVETDRYVNVDDITTNRDDDEHLMMPGTMTDVAEVVPEKGTTVENIDLGERDSKGQPKTFRRLRGENASIKLKQRGLGGNITKRSVGDNPNDSAEAVRARARRLKQG